MTTTLRIYTVGGHVRDTNLDDMLTAEAREIARVEANRWIKQLRRVSYGAADMRQTFAFRGESLWWFTELYLHKTRHLDRAAAATLALESVVEREAPARIAIDTDDPVVRDVAAAFGAARRLPIDVAGTARAGSGQAWPSYLIGLTAALSRLPPARRRPNTRVTVAAFVHNAFLAEPSSASPDVPGERYVGPVLDALARSLPAGSLRCVGVGPRRNFRARRWWDPLVSAGQPWPITPIERLAPRRALAASRALWRQRRELARAVTSGPGIREAGRFHGLDLWPVLERDLRGAALLQWPWSARAMDEAGAALDALEPEVVVTYAEAGGWGRALVLEARRRRVPTVGLQHGFIYRHWLNYLHEPDEAEAGADGGFPFPTRTLVFDELTAQHLQGAGAFPPDAVRVTGSPQLDELVHRKAAITVEQRRAFRHSVGATDDQPMLLLVAKGSEIGPDLPALREGLLARRDVRLLVKPHPAETAGAYEVLASLPNVVVASPAADLALLVAAADAMVTRNSTVAVDALMLGVPALVVGLPNNLSPFVDAGAMMGATPGKLGEALDALLYDREARRRLAEAGLAFSARAGMSADGRAAARAAEAILAERPSASPSDTRS